MAKLPAHIIVHNVPFFYLCEGYRKDMVLVRTVFGLTSKTAVLEPVPKSRSKFAIYVQSKDDILSAVNIKFSKLNMLADELLLDTNVSDISSQIASNVKKELTRKESEAESERRSKHDSKLKQEPEEHPHSPRFEWKPKKETEFGMEWTITGARKDPTFEEKLTTFKQKYMHTALDLLQAFKLSMPNEMLTNFVSSLKSLTVKPKKFTDVVASRYKI